ncbi:MAG: hypothetical protein BGO05_11840 [Rhizobiales bacterium 63-7]|nr:hypothetical protein [Hyphomicrobiales bacterium]OJU67421.1 MAG: hypothetical protein BGO05_11840 [Rhizobiales bacterium 63-7]
MEIYAYTLVVGKQQPIKGMGTVEDLVSLIVRMELPGTAPAEWIVSNPTIIDMVTGAMIYIHDESGPDEWRLRWVPFT